MTMGSGDICDDDLLELLITTGQILLKCITLLLEISTNHSQDLHGAYSLDVVFQCS